MTIESIGTLRIANVRGLSHLDVDLDLDTRVVLLSGANGTGKTSTCTALSLLLNGPAFDDGANPVHAGANVATVEGKIRRSNGQVLTRQVELDRKKLTSNVLEDGVARPGAAQADAVLPRRASVFFQDDLRVDLDPLVRALVLESKDVAALEQRFRAAITQVAGRLREQFPSRSRDTKDALGAERHACVQRFVAAWRAHAPSRQGPDPQIDLLLSNGKLPKHWASRLRSFVASLGQAEGIDVALRTGGSPSQVLEALDAALDNLATRLAADRDEPAPSAPRLHLPEHLLQSDATLVCLRGPERPELLSGEWPFAVDEAGLQPFRHMMLEAAHDILAGRNRSAEVERARQWAAGGAGVALAQVLGAVERDGDSWRRVPTLPGVDHESLQLALRALFAGSNEVTRARQHLAIWTQHVDAVSEQTGRTLESAHRRHDTLQALLALVSRGVNESRFRAAVDDLVPRARVSARELQERLNRALPHEPRENRPLADVLAAVRSWRHTEQRWEAHEQAEAADRGRQAALAVLDKVLGDLRSVVPNTGPGLLQEAAGIDARDEAEIQSAVLRVAKHSFRATGVNWAITREVTKSGTSIQPVALFESAQQPGSIEAGAASTGERTILGLALTVALNLLLEDRLDHRVLIWDDFTTALDLTQLPGVAMLIRRLAWAADAPRKVVLSSHHEELTNRLLDLLAPPPGERVRVLEFQTVSDTGGERVHTFQASGPTLCGWNEPRDVFAGLLDDGLRFLSGAPHQFGVAPQ